MTENVKYNMCKETLTKQEIKLEGFVVVFGGVVVVVFELFVFCVLYFLLLYFIIMF